MGGMRGAMRGALLAALAVLAAVLPPPSGGARAQPFPSLESPEPPLAGPPPLAPGLPLRTAEPADPPTPIVSLHVRAPATAAVGQEVDYRIFVANSSGAAAHHVTVRAPVPAGAAFVRASPDPLSRDPQLVWDLASLQPGMSKEILLTLKPGGAGDVDVTARVQFEHGESVHTRVGAVAAPPAAPPAPMPPTAPLPAAPATPTAQPKAALRLRKTGPARAVLGDLVAFQLNVTNIGTADALDVELDDSLPPGLEFWSRMDNGPTGNRRSWKIGRLAPGETAVRDYEAFAKTVGDQENVAQATAAGDLRETASWRVRVEEPKLSLTVVGPPKRLVGRTARYLITLTNTGPTPLTNVEASADLPAGTRLVGPPGGNGRVEQNHIRWLLGVAPAGLQSVLSVDLTADKDAEVVFHVAAKADRGVKDEKEVKTRFEGAVGLRVEIDKSADPVEAGRVVDYTIRIFNGGSAPTRNVQLAATIPSQMQPAAGADANQPTLAGQTLTYPALAALDAGKEATYTLHLRAVQAGEVKVAVELRSDDLSAPLHEEETTTIFGEGPPTVSPGPAPPVPQGPPGPPPPPGPPG